MKPSCQLFSAQILTVLLSVIVTSIKIEDSKMPVPDLEIPAPKNFKTKMHIPENRLLMGPGPSNCSPDVCAVNALPVIGHMHPEFFKIMDDIKSGLQYVFQTENKWTILISGPGHLAMEAVLVNLLESGDKILVGVNGLWGNRVSDLAHRIGAVPVKMEREPGTAFSLQEIETHLAKEKPKVIFLVHSESSTGVMQPLEGVGELCRKYGALLAVDTVASLVGVPFFADKWGVDAIYTGAQKSLSAPPGIAPISFSPRAVEVIKKRTTPIKSFLLDMNHLANYWDCNEGEARVYHHTPPVNLFYAMHQSLSDLVKEGLQHSWKRHAEAVKRLHDGVKDIGLEFYVKNEVHRLPTVTTLKVPAGIDWKAVTTNAMKEFDVEIAGGLGPTVGHVFRIGCMGYNAYPDRVDRALNALKESLKKAKC